MANDNIVLLRHLKQSALRCAAMVTSKISELTTVFTEALEELDDTKQDKLTFDTTPTEGSTNPVTSDGIVKYIAQANQGGGISEEDFNSLLETAMADAPDITVKDGIMKVESTEEGTTQYMSASPAGFIVLSDGKIISVMSESIQFVGSDSAKITGLALPIDDDYATNKEYVDSLTKGVKTTGTGAAYTATVPGITELTSGVSFIMVPHAESTTTTPTLNVNGLGAKPIKRRVSTISGTLKDGYADSWLGANNPLHVIYNGTYWVVQGMEQPNVYDLSGAVPVTKGGTGYTGIADTTYTTARYRASALFEEETDPTTNGVINWTYK